MSPAWGGYAKQKLGADVVSTRHRLNMCRLAAAASEFIMVPF